MHDLTTIQLMNMQAEINALEHRPIRHAREIDRAVNVVHLAFALAPGRRITGTFLDEHLKESLYTPNQPDRVAKRQTHRNG